MLTNVCVMTEREKQIILAELDRVEREASNSKEFTLKYLEEAGVMEIIRRSNEEDEEDQEQGKN